MVFIYVQKYVVNYIYNQINLNLQSKEKGRSTLLPDSIDKQVLKGGDVNRIRI